MIGPGNPATGSRSKPGLHTIGADLDFRAAEFHGECVARSQGQPVQPAQPARTGLIR